MTQAKTNLYDINVYCGDEGILSVIAHKLEMDCDGETIITSYADYTALRLDMMNPDNEDALRYLLGKDYEYRGPDEWVDHDEWIDAGDLIQHNTPTILKDWFNSLPMYEIEGAEA